MVTINEKVRAARKILDLRGSKVDAEIMIERREDFLKVNRTIHRFATSRSRVWTRL